MPHAEIALLARRRGSRRWAHLLVVTLLYTSPVASEPLLSNPAESPVAELDAVSQTDSKTGVGIGQLACGDFSKSADRLVHRSLPLIFAEILRQSEADASQDRMGYAGIGTEASSLDARG